MHPDLSAIAAYVMPELPLRACDVGLLFGTRHGVEEFCLAAHDLWERGMFRVLLVSRAWSNWGCHGRPWCSKRRPPIRERT